MYDLTKDWSTLPSRTEATRLRAARELDRPPSPDVQVPWAIPEFVALGAAVSGRIVQEGQDTRNFALDFDSFKREAIAAVQAGAAMVHIDTGGISAIMQSGLSVPQIYDKICGELDAEMQLDWIPDANVLRGRNFAENMYPITAGLTETTLMAPRFPVDWMQSAAQVCLDHNIPLFMVIHSAAEVDLADRYLISQGLIRRPYCFDVLIGYPYDDATDWMATYMPNPRAMMQELMLVVDRIKEIDEDAFIMVNASGRAGHYLASQAMLMGLHVRTGTEDMAFRFPHRNDLIASNTECIERVKMTAEALGRRLATPAEYRKMVGATKREPKRKAA
jgi:3-keto-5-aminohexanoate cleavage enzyme